MDDSGTTEVSQGERGEIWCKGLNIMRGYWKNLKATEESLTPDGWLKTGDIAYVDAKGVLFVVDRKKVRYTQARFRTFTNIDLGTNQSKRFASRTG